MGFNIFLLGVLESIKFKTLILGFRCQILLLGVDTGSVTGVSEMFSASIFGTAMRRVSVSVYVHWVRRPTKESWGSVASPSQYFR
jgi:hypothetical protein